LRTEDNVKVAIDAKKAGADGLFLMPPIGGMDITSTWNADKYPEVFIDFVKPAVEAVDLPAIVHPSAPYSPAFGPGIPLAATLEICKEVPNIVGWKMTYNYEGSLLIANALRAMDRHIGILRAGAKYFHENLATGFFDGTVSGYWTYAMEPMLEHITAWRAKEYDKACMIFNSGLATLHHYVSADRSSRLHTRYKVATWLRGLIPLPFMRPPMPQPRKEEVLTLQKLLTAIQLNVRPQKEIDAVMAQLRR
jgi:4-hydroxy-tetrahydrodipicolinate synthase